MLTLSQKRVVFDFPVGDDVSVFERKFDDFFDRLTLDQCVQKLVVCTQDYLRIEAWSTIRANQMISVSKERLIHAEERRSAWEHALRHPSKWEKYKKQQAETVLKQLGAETNSRSELRTARPKLLAFVQELKEYKLQSLPFIPRSFSHYAVLCCAYNYAFADAVTAGGYGESALQRVALDLMDTDDFTDDFAPGI
jgi:hypothetical protein